MPVSKPAARVGAVLVEREAHERLDAGEEHPAVLEAVAVLEADLVPDGPAAARGTALPPVRMGRILPGAPFQGR